MDNIDKEILISLVEARDVLWDKTLENKDKRKTLKAWRDMCVILNENFESLPDVEKNKYASISLLISWLTLECKLQPDYPELQEITITKLLYLHDPQACGRVYFYNYTVLLRQKLARTAVQWPVKNDIALAFRQKIKVWVAVHILWLLFCIVYMTQGHRPCGFYATLLPFTLIGLMILVMDVVYTGLFLSDTRWTNTEDAILKYINLHNNSILAIPMKPNRPFGNMVKEPMTYEDTSWISLLFAYASCRGIVLWVFNFWMIKDNYFEGLALYRQLQIATEKV